MQAEHPYTQNLERFPLHEHTESYKARVNRLGVGDAEALFPLPVKESEAQGTEVPEADATGRGASTLLFSSPFPLLTNKKY